MKKIIIIIFVLITVNLYSQTQVINRTKYDVDKYITVACEILNMNIIVNVQYMPSLTHFDINYDLKSTIVKSNQNNYIIYINDDYYTKKNYKKIIIHELIHVHQFYSGKLYKIDDDKYIYNDKLINISDVEYMNRQFEIDAYNLDDDLLQIVEYLIKLHND